MKAPNPFKPGKRLTRPELFAGRTPQLEDGLSLLRQAAAGNARHALITGDRGIGKSSLSSQIQGMAIGDPQYLALLGPGTPTFNFLVAEYIAQRGDGVEAISSGLLQALDRARGLGGKALKWDLELDLKVVKAHVAQAASTRAVTTAFVDALETAWRSVEQKADGTLLVIDELDRVADSPGVPTFLKVATEMLAARGLEHVVVMPVGMVGVQDILAAEHASVPRIFEPIHVPLLEPEESMDIVYRALQPTGVTIEESANQTIAGLCGGFPHPVHLIGSEAYEADSDGIINQDDLARALTVIVSEKSRQEFESSLIAAGSGKNRQIIKSLANYPDEHNSRDVPIAYVCAELGVTQPEISSNIGNLMKKDVIVRVDRGIYRIKDALFGIYVGMLDMLGSEPIERRPRKRPPSAAHRAARPRQGPQSGDGQSRRPVWSAPTLCGRREGSLPTPVRHSAGGSTLSRAPFGWFSSARLAAPGCVVRPVRCSWPERMLGLAWLGERAQFRTGVPDSVRSRE